MHMNEVRYRVLIGCTTLLLTTHNNFLINIQKFEVRVELLVSSLEHKSYFNTAIRLIGKYLRVYFNEKWIMNSVQD